MSNTTIDYRKALGNTGPLAYEWNDKPHRLVYDLANAVDNLEEAIKEEVDLAKSPRLAKLLKEMDVTRSKKWGDYLEKQVR